MFENDSDYSQYVGGGGTDYVEPHVVAIKNSVNVYYKGLSMPEKISKYLTIEALEDGLEFDYDNNSCYLQYSYDEKTWTSYVKGQYPILNTGEKIYLKGSFVPGQNRYGVGYMNIENKKFNVSGNIMSLLFGDEAEGKTDLTGYDNCFDCLFYETPLVDASKLLLPATILAPYCYQSLFCACDYLIGIPELPATTLAEGCYCDMFDCCTSLTTVPELPATTLAEDCYDCMFLSCTSLTAAPELPATTLAKDCYAWMFEDCSSLTTAPELPATTLAEDCYYSMFNGCSNLNYIKMLATDISANNCLNSWVDGVSSTGTFVKNAAATWNVTGVNGIPEGWTVETV